MKVQISACYDYIRERIMKFTIDRFLHQQKRSIKNSAFMCTRLHVQLERCLITLRPGMANSYSIILLSCNKGSLASQPLIVCNNMLSREIQIICSNPMLMITYQTVLVRTEPVLSRNINATWAALQILLVCDFRWVGVHCLVHTQDTARGILLYTAATLSDRSK